MRPEEFRLSGVLAARRNRWLADRTYPPTRLIDGIFEIPMLLAEAAYPLAHRAIGWSDDPMVLAIVSIWVGGIHSSTQRTILL